MLLRRNTSRHGDCGKVTDENAGEFASMKRISGLFLCVVAAGCAQPELKPQESVGRLYSIENVSAGLGGVTLAPKGTDVALPPFSSKTWKSDSYKNRLKIEMGARAGESFCRLETKAKWKIAFAK